MVNNAGSSSDLLESVLNAAVEQVIDNLLERNAVDEFETRTRTVSTLTSSEPSRAIGGGVSTPIASSSISQRSVSTLSAMASPIFSLEKTLPDLLTDLLLLTSKIYRQVYTGKNNINFIPLKDLVSKIIDLIPRHSKANLLTAVPIVNLEEIHDIESQQQEKQQTTLMKIRTWILHLSQFI